MKIKEGFSLHELGDEYIVIHDGMTNVNFDKLLSLNATAAFLWKAMGHKEWTMEQLVTLLTEEYEVEREQAQKDVERFVGLLMESEVAE